MRKSSKGTKKINIIPTWSQFLSWSIPNKATYIAFLLGIIALFWSIITYYSEPPNVETKGESIGQTDEDASMLMDEMDTIKTLIGRLQEKATPIKKTTLTPSKKSDKSSFKLTGYFTKDLIEKIKKSTNLKHDQAKGFYTIEITHSGEITLFTSDKIRGLYTFSGGTILIKINSQECEMENFLLEETFPPGDPKIAIEKWLRKKISSIIADNIDYFANTVEKCII